ncbi:hypothetical protein Btru_067206 [Bulinus truncatus]|nr:hypothetical protein Btru_067206 [Bulinus truncatus]
MSACTEHVKRGYRPGNIIVRSTSNSHRSSDRYSWESRRIGRGILPYVIHCKCQLRASMLTKETGVTVLGVNLAYDVSYELEGIALFVESTQATS